MENLVKQMRVRFSGLGQDNQGVNNSRERRLPPQKTQSFKGERKNWFQRQFSGQMIQDKDSSENIEFATMVAAAAFAVNSLEEEGMQNQKKTGSGLEKTKSSKSRKEENRIVSADPGRVSRRFSEKEIVKVEKPTPGKGSMEISEIEEVADQKMTNEVALPLPAPILKKPPTFADQTEAFAGRSPTIKKTPTFSDAYLNDTTYKRVGTSEDIKPSGSHTVSANGGVGQRKTNSTISRDADAKARTWEETEMARIKKRYEKMKSTIDSWENEKKTKERRRIDRKESQLEKKRARALKHFRVEISKIDQVAGGARALADERRKNEEIKTKEKVKKIRSTGKLPATCFCF